MPTVHLQVHDDFDDSAREEPDLTEGGGLSDEKAVDGQLTLSRDDSAIEGLREAFAVANMKRDMQNQGVAWCQSRGAECLGDVMQVFDTFAADLKLKPLEKKRLEKALNAAIERYGPGENYCDAPAEEAPAAAYPKPAQQPSEASRPAAEAAPAEKAAEGAATAYEKPGTEEEDPRPAEAEEAAAEEDQHPRLSRMIVDPVSSLRSQLRASLARCADFSHDMGASHVVRYAALPCADPDKAAEPRDGCEDASAASLRSTATTQYSEEEKAASSVPRCWWPKYVLLAVCLVCYGFGITQALFVVSSPAYAGTGEPPVQRSNLELISFLSSQGMPSAALAVLVFSVAIPVVKFGMVFLVLWRPKMLSPPQLHWICRALCAISPYQMCDIFLVMFMLSYLNIGMASPDVAGSGYSCELCGGFTTFFVYCVSSVVLAQLLEAEMEMEANIFFNNSAPATSVREVFSARSTPGRASIETADEAEDRASCSGRLQFRIVTGLWFLCLVAMALPAPPLSLQVRIAGLVVYRQDPTILELFASLAAQSLCFAAVEVVLVVIAPLCCVLHSLFQPQTSCAKIAQSRIISPSVMGDVAAVALCTLYLSIQEPWSKFVRLCVRLPDHPWVLCAVLGAGVCSAWLRGSAQAAGAGRSQGCCCSACAGAVWVFWCLAICFLGPTEPARPANLRELNMALRTKTPIRKRTEDKPQHEKIIQAIDDKVDDITEQFKSMRLNFDKIQDRLEECCDDQYVFRKQQLWALQAQVREQRDKAAKEECMVGWPASATATQRTEFVKWCLKEADIDISTCDISHSVKYQQLSPMTILTFRHPSLRIQMDKWFKEEYINKKKTLNFYMDGQCTTDAIKLRPQVAVWDRIKGEPLKICLKAMDIANRTGQIKVNMDRVKPWWNHNAIYDDYYTFAWVYFSVRDVQAIVYLDQSIYKAVKDTWAEAAQALRTRIPTEPSSSSQSKGKGNSKGKGKAFDTTLGEYPFEFKLAEVKDWHYDRDVRAHQEQARDEDM
ncbi:unnamed protein product [Symbiodinium sp. KB8]|nr:unnamed protein product [Symbiodinium sp. KB8]